MTTKEKMPKGMIKLLCDMDESDSRKRASGLRHIEDTIGDDHQGEQAREPLHVKATGRASLAVMWLDAAFIGTADYMGTAAFWSYEYRHYLRDATCYQRQRVHAAMLKAGLPVCGDSDQHLAIIRKATGKR
jgi:hypothetical protein